MIKIILGNPGSGKTVTAIKMMADRNYMTFCNFKTNLPNAVRLKKSHIIEEKDGKKKVNFKFWQKLIDKNQKFDIVIDEVHNVLHSRKSMSKWNILFSTWLTQIRKILGSSEKNHLFLISQRLYAIDISARELANEIIYCTKRVSKKRRRTWVLKKGSKKLAKRLSPTVYIQKLYFRGKDCIRSYLYWEHGHKSWFGRTWFIANDYFKFYDSYQLVTFGDTAYV